MWSALKDCRDFCTTQGAVTPVVSAAMRRVSTRRFRRADWGCPLADDPMCRPDQRTSAAAARTLVPRLGEGIPMSVATGTVGGSQSPPGWAFEGYSTAPNFRLWTVAVPSTPDWRMGRLS
jgi:hypothetical protein